MKSAQGRVRTALLTGGRAFVLSFASIVGSTVLFVLSVLSVVFVVLGLGLVTTPWVTEAVRRHANRRRLLAAEWSGIRIPVPYRPFPKDVRAGFTGQVERTTLLLKDPATWRDLRWLLLDMTAGYVLLVLTFALLVYPLEGLVLAAGLWRVFEDSTYWYGFVPVSGQGTGLAAAALGVALFLVGMWASGPLLRLHFVLARSALSPAPGELSQRIDRLTETRHEAVDTAASELRRIERDLHDGAQARLVAMGMNLGTIEALVEKDPAEAKKLLAMARTSSAEALTELRDLVRGIHPPVLAERGLGDAVKALALRLPVSSEVTVELPGRADAPVESAAYFAVSETLTNVVKHAEADRLWVDVHHADGMLRISVTDNGRGGASVGGGSGLSGIERRLGTFDGVLAVSSPAGGPTMVTMEIPCALS
ncbi:MULTISPECIES: sensor domain-containing protein [Streptomyces]|uniref:histidine kinase n=2 Tax=Streptomyces TaxID=1883 RepID=A0A652KLM6_9ACTN|nr:MULTISPECIES: sensor domain-containing protein [unclassified Streptomyces]WSS68494.1 sensor domain-containing protein [Streptomyces sp. NBC_01175]MDX3326745.1 sensor domain-containing protein [Streptomyces sp. ME02-6979-3A]MDX3430113.1 sensor domain-containing protein [Streptomyces sp. ME01-18a]MDX3686057.1 sensor domain-containing protein [Streptomyces sp. AK04-4c]RPK42744.1 Sensor histidine kinase LiaS [Streptomyces sp. ADI93-02]